MKRPVNTLCASHEMLFQYASSTKKYKIRKVPGFGVHFKPSQPYTPSWNIKDVYKGCGINRSG